MKQSKARTVLKALRAERAETVNARDAAQRRIMALEKVIEGYLELFPEET